MPEDIKHGLLERVVCINVLPIMHEGDNAVLANGFVVVS